MGRPRKKGRNVPTGVYFNKNRWFLRRDGKEIRLAGADATPNEVFAAWYALQNIKAPHTENLEWLCDEYLESPQFKALAPATQRDYRICKTIVCETPLQDGTAFGSVPANVIKPPGIAKYRDKRAAVSPSRANRELAFLSVTSANGVELGHVTDNPVKGVRKLALKARKRCPTDAEYDAVYKAAPEWLQIGMELAYLCRLRWSEVFGTDLMAKHDDSAPGLLRQHVLENGLRVIRGKGSKEQVINWTPRLREAVNRALKLPSKIGTMRLIHNQGSARWPKP